MNLAGTTAEREANIVHDFYDIRTENGPSLALTGFKDSGFRVQGSGFRVQGSGFRVQGSGLTVEGSGLTSRRRG